MIEEVPVLVTIVTSKNLATKLAASGAKLTTCLGKGYHISYVSGKGTSLQNYFPKSKSMNGQ